MNSFSNWLAVNRLDMDYLENNINTGFNNFDDKFGGFPIGKLVVLGGRPSMGKTQFLQSMCKNISEYTSILYCTFDQTPSIITARFLSSLSNIPIDKILQNSLEHNERTKLDYYEKYALKYKLRITDQGRFIDDFKKQSIKHISEFGVKLIIIDYLQKMTAKRLGNKSHISTLTSELKSFANENNVSIIAVSQLNRTVENRGWDRRPQLYDLKGSESIEEDADKVIFIYRHDYYGIEVDENGDKTKGIVELIMAKNKNGKLGTVKFLRDINFTVINS